MAEYQRALPAMPPTAILGGFERSRPGAPSVATAFAIGAIEGAPGNRDAAVEWLDRL
jgi:hypothetical protein